MYPVHHFQQGSVLLRICKQYIFGLVLSVSAKVIKYAHIIREMSIFEFFDPPPLIYFLVEILFSTPGDIW